MNYQEFSRVPHKDEGCALFYKEHSESKYHILIPLEEIPTMQGDRDEIEYGYTTMAVNGVMKGRLTATTAETDFYWHRDFTNKLKTLKGKQIDLLVVLPSWQGYFARGEVSYSYNNVTRGELVKGTISITPSWIDDTHTDNVLDFCQETANITSAFDTELTISLADYKTNGYSFAIEKYPTTATITFAYESQENYKASGVSTILGATFESDAIKITPKTTGTEIIKASISASGFATWDTYFAVKVVA